MIVNFGSLNIDYVYAVDHLVKPGETLSSSKMQIYPGGKGLNQSIAIARAGGQIMHAGIYGRGGEFLFEILKDSGVDISQLTRLNQENGHAIIQVDADAENAILLHGGTNEMVDEAYVDAIMSRVDDSAIVLMQNETTSVGYMMKQAKAKGCTVAFNPAPMNAKALDYPLEYVDVLILNETEGEGLSGEHNTEDILNKLQSQYPKMKIILTLGSQGAWLARGGKKAFVPACKAHNVVDTTAAGDTFIGYYLACLDEGQGDIEAMMMAAKAAAITVTKAGAAVSIPRLADVKERI